MREMRVTFLIGIAVILTGLGSSRSETSEPFTVTAIIKGSSGFSSVNQEVEINATICNISNHSETFVVTGGCRYAFWKTGNPSLVISGHEICQSNVLKPITLKPKEKYVEQLFVRPTKKAGQGEFKFRVGFTPYQQGKDSFDAGPEYPTMWSNFMK